jgi:hypothetical protein
MIPKDPPPAGGAPLRAAIAEAYEHASALSDYFGRLMADALAGGDAIPSAPALAEVEALTGALAEIVRELPRLAMKSGSRAPEKIDEAAQG